MMRPPTPRFVSTLLGLRLPVRGSRRSRTAQLPTLGIVLALLNVVLSSDASAQVVGALGKGVLLDTAGSLTSDPNEVISGKTSIKGSYSGSASYTPFLFTDRNF